MKVVLAVFLLFLTTAIYGQDTSTLSQTKKVAINSKILVDSVSINPSKFSVLDFSGKVIDSTNYQIDFTKSELILSEIVLGENDSITIEYLRYPEFLTKDYFQIDESVIVNSEGAIDKLYTLDQSTRDENFTPFDGLNTAGSISRGITIGNNQNAVVDSQLDLQITGKLNDKVSIRASIQDANIPSQQGGYSQNLDEFDQIFIELYSDNWNIRAGDVDLQNSGSYFANFTKKVQGISLGGTINHDSGAKTNAYAAGALVRGVFTQSNFVGQEGNQGPYKLVGPNGELLVLIVSGSENVYVNGILLKRGENEDYIIDYNAGEIKFNPTYPINANMRIRVEYQATERSYTRFIGYGGGEYTSETFDIGAYVYTENDAKNQPLQQNLSEEQVAILQEAGDDMSLMNAPSASPEEFTEGRVLYRKVIANGVEFFVFSNNADDELFNVRFTLVGDNLGDYILSDTNAINRVFEYVPPVAGVKQGNYEPFVRLNAPTKLQIGGINGSYHPTEKTKVDFELAGSVNDLNLFSDIGDDNNDGIAVRFDARQNLLTRPDSLKIIGAASIDYINEDFRNIERLYNVEFNRDWNITNPLGNQRFSTAGFEVSKPKNGNVTYQYQNLNYSENYNGNRHQVSANLKINKLKIQSQSSYLDSDGENQITKFFRGYSRGTYTLNKAWAGAKVGFENNRVRNKEADTLTPLSLKYNAYEVFAGVGDSTKIFIETGYEYRTNDSLRNSNIERVSTSNTFYAKSKLLNNTNSQLSIFANYRILDNVDVEEKEQSLNARILYNQTLFKGLLRSNTTIDTNNGVVPQQEFTYIEVDAGEGVYTWNDYNENGVQELEEFEIAQFQDEANFVRILLPNQVFVKIRENKFGQTLTLNPQRYSGNEGFLKILSRFYNTISYVIDRKIIRANEDFNINPFKDGGEDQLGLTLNFRNALFFNRGKQRYTTSYTYLKTASDNLQSFGLQSSTLKSHQFNFTHKMKEVWLFSLKTSLGNNESTSENFSNRNYNLDTYEINPKISYLLNSQTRFDVFYNRVNKDNTINGLEMLDQNKLGLSFAYANAEKISINGEFAYIENGFEGSAFSPVAYQMLEGLQPGTNFTWRLLFQKRITKYLDANITYNGRKSEASNTIHTGSVQLRAFF
ncbi:hypothetical protein ULMA_09890 [Patiriisocius marinus]|uniref:Uncharacterized protein n=1 Tax=Patiriisocius marinus TaxID=1397112 RepID=A0A5J4IZ99_9FLAO|nr:hypothetical protein [Patiriisocius marinus]GER58881.1 hypothetical protein ULMA_09890 [Patiriisocius marinus]